jgi:hypothetical protein
VKDRSHRSRIHHAGVGELTPNPEHVDVQPLWIATECQAINFHRPYNM